MKTGDNAMVFILHVYASRTEWHALVSKDFQKFPFTRNNHYSYFHSYLNKHDKTDNLSTLTYRRNQTVGKGVSGVLSLRFGVYHLIYLSLLGFA
nr:MAG TPA: hypothetical protein [Caudoviricetes sp.]